jgi:hypothetical protein
MFLLSSGKKRFSLFGAKEKKNVCRVEKCEGETQ